MTVQNYADVQRDLLDRLNGTVMSWWDMFANDPVNIALGVSDMLLEDLIDLRRIRWYSIASAAQVEELWKRFVAQEELQGEVREAKFDFYMNGATHMWLSTPAVDNHIDQVIRHLATALSWVRSSSMVPTEIREYSVSQDTMGEILRTNHWILFMVLLSMLPVKIDQ